jgi:hypothetical protein
MTKRNYTQFIFYQREIFLQYEISSTESLCKIVLFDTPSGSRYYTNLFRTKLLINLVLYSNKNCTEV